MAVLPGGGASRRQQWRPQDVRTEEDILGGAMLALRERAASGTRGGNVRVAAMQ
jgi:hypothetical protein